MPISNVTVSEYVPSLDDVELMYSMFSTPFTCCSIGAATVLANTSAFAPGYTAVTRIVGGVISGYCSTGKTYNATPPITIVMMAMTLAKIGRSMKKRANTSGYCSSGAGDGDVESVGG